MILASTDHNSAAKHFIETNNIVWILNNGKNGSYFLKEFYYELKKSLMFVLPLQKIEIGNTILSAAKLSNKHLTILQRLIQTISPNWK